MTRTWRKIPILVVGTLLAPGQRTVSVAWYVRGLQDKSRLAVYHQVLSRARGSSLAVSRVWLRHLVTATGLLLFGIDETVEQHKGPRIAAQGVCWEGVRAPPHRHFVKTTGWRGICLIWLAYILWAVRVWALPFLTILAPSCRYHEERGVRHPTLTEWARQMVRCLRRGGPDRERVGVGDPRYAWMRSSTTCRHPVRPGRTWPRAGPMAR